MNALRPTVIAVALGSRRYHVHVGRGLSGRPLGAMLARALGTAYRERVHVVGDARALAVFPAIRRHSAHPALSFPPGERSKSMAVAARLLSALARQGAHRSSAVLAFGGGVAGDLGGFVASLYMRGVPCVQVPTTLLAQVDSSVGGKTAVDLPEGKNLAGTFHQPLLVVADPDLLATLPLRQTRSGLAEVLKAALVAGGAPWERVRSAPSLPGDAGAVDRMIRDAVRLKARIVSADERESGPRRVLNLGHTLGHALESATGFRHYLHGEAVAVGLCFAALLSRELCGLADPTVQDVLRIASPLARRPARARPGIARLLAAAARDKKAVGGRLTWILLEAPGRPRIVTGVPDGALRRAAEGLERLGLL